MGKTKKQLDQAQEKPEVKKDEEPGFVETVKLTVGDKKGVDMIIDQKGTTIGDILKAGGVNLVGRKVALNGRETDSLKTVVEAGDRIQVIGKITNG